MVIGRKVIVVKHRHFPGLIGMEGEIVEVFETHYTDGFENGTFYRVVATNDGPYVKGSSGTEKKVRAWKVGDKMSFRKGLRELELIKNND